MPTIAVLILDLIILGLHLAATSIHTFLILGYTESVISATDTKLIFL